MLGMLLRLMALCAPCIWRKRSHRGHNGNVAQITLCAIMGMLLKLITVCAIMGCRPDVPGDQPPRDKGPQDHHTGNANPSCYPLRPILPLPHPPEIKSILGVICGVLLWADMNAATPLGAWGRSVISLGRTASTSGSACRSATPASTKPSTAASQSRCRAISILYNFRSRQSKMIL